jgi:hypothetical protein
MIIGTSFVGATMFFLDGISSPLSNMVTLPFL